jgi:hypothetical protein
VARRQLAGKTATHSKAIIDMSRSRSIAEVTAQKHAATHCGQWEFTYSGASVNIP